MNLCARRRKEKTITSHSIYYLYHPEYLDLDTLQICEFVRKDAARFKHFPAISASRTLMHQEARKISGRRQLEVGPPFGQTDCASTLAFYHFENSSARAAKTPSCSIRSSFTVVQIAELRPSL